MKTVLITGATSGIGYAVAKVMAAQGGRVIGVGRTKENCDSAKAGIQNNVPLANVVYFHGDLMQQSEVNSIADKIADHLDE